jgi:hypothetical protein
MKLKRTIIIKSKQLKLIILLFFDLLSLLNEIVLFEKFLFFIHSLLF